MPDRFQIRLEDYSLDDDQRAVRDSFRSFFTRECPATVVRAAEPLGHDVSLWNKMQAIGGASLGIPSELGGAGATLVDLVIIAEEIGRAVAPVPFVTQAVALRSLVRAGAGGLLERAVRDGELIGLALHRDLSRPQLVVPGAVATAVLAYDGTDLAWYQASKPGELVPNTGSVPLARWSARGYAKTAITRAGDEFSHLLAEWRLLTAGTLVGLTDAALALTVEFVKTRETMGVPVGALQGVSHPLADVAMSIQTARHLSWRAAWMLEHEPDTHPELPALAFAHAVRAATRGTTVSAHMQGGLGCTVESDVSLYFLRAKSWGVLPGDPEAALRAAGQSVLAAASAAA